MCFVKTVVGEELDVAIHGFGHGRGIAVLKAAGDELLAMAGDLGVELLADRLADLVGLAR